MALIKLVSQMRKPNAKLHPKRLRREIIVSLTLMCFTDSHVFFITKSSNFPPMHCNVPLRNRRSFPLRGFAFFCLGAFLALRGTAATFSIYKYWEFKGLDKVV